MSERSELNKYLAKTQQVLGKMDFFAPKIGKKVVDELIKDNTIFTNKSIANKKIIPGSILLYDYDPKDKSQVYDYRPLIIVMNISKKYVLGCNLHWITLKERLEILKLLAVYNLRHGNSDNPKHLLFTYELLKFYMQPYQKKFKCVRLYLRNRISKKCALIPPRNILDVARLKYEDFK